MDRYGPEGAGAEGAKGEQASDGQTSGKEKDGADGEVSGADGDEGEDTTPMPEETIQYCRIKLEDMTRLLIDWQYIESLDKMVPPLATNGQGRIFTKNVHDIVHHPERPRKLLHGTTLPEEAISEFVSAAVLKLQHLFAAPPLPEEELSDDFIHQDLFSE